MTRSFNRRFGQIRKVVDELRSRSSLDLLLHHLEHEDPWVRFRVAVNCRRIARERVEAVLEELGRGRYGIILDGEAREALELMRFGPEGAFRSSS